MRRVKSTRIAGLFLVVFAAVVAAFLPGAASADHSGPALFFTDALDAPVEYAVLPDDGDSVQLRVAAHGIGAGNANLVQLKISYDLAIVSISGVNCIGMYIPALINVSEEVPGEFTGDSTWAICSTINGPLIDEGSVIEFTLTRLAPGDGTLSFSEINTESHPLGTTFIDAGTKFKDLEPPLIVDTSASVAVVSAIPTATPEATITPEVTSTPVATVQATATSAPPPFIPPPPTATAKSAPALVAPSTPLNVTATLSDGNITVAWDDPSSDGGSPITAFLVSNSATGAVIAAPPEANSVVIEGLEPGISYRFQVATRTLIGNSSASASTAPITIPLPATPTPEPTTVPTATPEPTSTPVPTVIPTATPILDGGTTSVIDTTISASADEWDVLQVWFEEAFGDGILIDDAPIAVESTDGLVTVELVAAGVTASDAIKGALVVQLGNLALDTVDGVGIGSISLGTGLVLEGTVQLTTKDDAIVAELTNNQLVYSPVPPPSSSIGDLTQVRVEFRVDVSQIADGASLTVTYASTAEELVEVAGAVFELAASNGVTLDPEIDIAFAVNVAKTGITNDELGTNVVTLTVDLAWYQARIAEGKRVVITKIGDDGVVHTVEAVCEQQGAVVLCTAVFEGEAGGFSWFALVALVEPRETGGSGGPGTGPASPQPTEIASTPVPAPAPTTVAVVAPTAAASDSTPPETPEGSDPAPATIAPAPTAVPPSATPQILPTSAPALEMPDDTNVLPGLNADESGGGLAWWIWILIVIVAAPAATRAVMTIVAMGRRSATARGA